VSGLPADARCSTRSTHAQAQWTCFSIDVEDWFHILDFSAGPRIEDWATLKSCVATNVERLFALLDEFGVKATFFWLGWIAERNKELVRQCLALGHEVASHGYGHVLAYQVGREAFGEDVRRGKSVLEDITGGQVVGFRAAGFSTKNDTRWAFEEIRAAGHAYDSSVFPASRSHGGMTGSRLDPHVLKTTAGDLLEIPQSMVEIMGRRISFFGGGYLRLAPLWLIQWGVGRLQATGRPLILYVHPREIDPNHERLSLPLWRRFKCYVNLRSTLPKLRYLCSNRKFVTMGELAARVSCSDMRDTRHDLL